MNYEIDNYLNTKMIQYIIYFSTKPNDKMLRIRYVQNELLK